MTKILIADDHPLIRQAVKGIVKEELNAETWEARDPIQVLESLRRDEFDLVILDLNMPGGGGIEVLRQIKKTHPKVGVLVLSMYPEDEFGLRVLREGADGYITKRAAGEQLAAAIKKVLAGGKYISPALAEKMASAIGRGVEKPSHESLSSREFQIFIMLALGKTVSDIAEELSLSQKTIRELRARMMDKMKFRNTVELARYAIENQLVD